MKRLSAVVILSIIFCVCVAVPSAMAIGLGIYSTNGWGEAAYNAENDAGTDWEFDADIERRGYGFSFDTAVAKDRLINLRFNLGYYNWEEEIDGSAIADLDGFQFTADLGFGLVRNKHLRLWVGPELTAAYGDGSLEENDDFEINLINIGVGPAVGVNFHMGSRVSFGIKVGWLYERFVGEGENTISDATVDYDGSTTQYFANFSVFYRFWDVF